MYSKTIKWTAGNGQQASVTVAVKQCLDQQGRRKPGTAEIQIDAYIDRAWQGSSLQRIKHPVAVAKIGDLGIKADNYAEIEAAIKESRQDPELVAYNDRYATAAAEQAECDDSHDRIVSAMRAGE